MDDDNMVILEPGVLYWIPKVVEEPDSDEEHERNLTDDEFEAVYCMYENGGTVHPADHIDEKLLPPLERLGFVKKVNITESCPEGEWCLTTAGFEVGELLVS